MIFCYSRLNGLREKHNFHTMNFTHLNLPVNEFTKSIHLRNPHPQEILKVSIISEIPSQPLPGHSLCLQRQLLFFIIKYQVFLPVHELRIKVYTLV